MQSKSSCRWFVALVLSCLYLTVALAVPAFAQSEKITRPDTKTPFAKLAVSPKSIGFKVDLDKASSQGRHFTLKNTGTLATTVTVGAPSGPGASDYTIVSPPQLSPAGGTISIPGKAKHSTSNRLEVEVAFAPTAAGKKIDATIAITDPDTKKPTNTLVKLHGTAMEKKPRATASELDTANTLKGIAASAETLAPANEAYLELLAEEISQIPQFVAGFKSAAMSAIVSHRLDSAVAEFTGMAGPADLTPPSTISTDVSSAVTVAAMSLMHFESSSLYGDPKHELPRATCDFTSNPSGNCVANPNALAITYKDAITGQAHTATFDWTGASTGTASPTVQGHDPQNTSISFELPTKLAFSFTDGSATVVSLVVDIQWHPSGCVSGQVLFDLPDSVDVSGFIAGADGTTKILNLTALSASFGTTTAQTSVSASAAGGGALLTGAGSVSATGSVVRGGSCGGLETASLTSLAVNLSASDGADSFEAGVNAGSITPNSSGVPVSALLSGGTFTADGNSGTFAGLLDDSNGDKIPGDNVSINFSGGTVSLEHFLVSDLGFQPKTK
jgi:hypothetical protein